MMGDVVHMLKGMNLATRKWLAAKLFACSAIPQVGRCC